MKIYSYLKILGLTVFTASLVGLHQVVLARSSNQTEKIDLSESTPSKKQLVQNQPNPVDNIKSIAEKITVRIDYGSNNGSGVIVARDGNTYYVLTAKHVVDQEREYQVVAPDGQTYPLDYSTVKKEQFGETDLAVFEFQSQTTYDVATLANFEQRAAVHQAKKANFDPADPNRTSELGTQQENSEKASEKETRIANLSDVIKNACPKQKEALETAPSPENLELYQNCINEKVKEYEGTGSNNHSSEETIEQKASEAEALCKEHEKKGEIDLLLECMRINMGDIVGEQTGTYPNEIDLNEIDPEKSTEPNVAIDYRIPLLFLYGWSKGDGETKTPLFVVGRYHRSNLEESAPSQSFIKYGSAVQFPSPSSEFIALSSSADNFNVHSRKYDIFYTNSSYGGMSGGPVLDYNGNLVAIHTGVEGEQGFRKSYLLGYSNGIFIDKFLEKTNQLGIALNLLNIENSTQKKLTVEDWQALSSAFNNYLGKDQDLTSQEDWINYGNQMWREFRYQEAAKAFNKAIEINTNSHLAYYGLGKSISDSAVKNRIQLKKINQSFRKAVEIKPEFFPAWKELGDHLHILTFSEIEEIHPFKNDNPEQAYEELMKPKVEESLYAYEKALALDPNNAYIHSKIGQMHFMQKSCPSALASFDKAISIEDSAVYHQYKSLIYMAMGDYDQAKSEYEIYAKNRSNIAPPGVFPYQLLFQPPSAKRDYYIQQRLNERFLDRC